MGQSKSWLFRSPEAGIGSACQPRQKVQAKARPVGQADLAMLDHGETVHQLPVPAGIVGAHAFQNQRIGRVERKMAGRGPDHRPGAVMRCDGKMPGLRHAGDRLGLGQPAAPAKVEHHNVDGVFLHQGTELLARRQRLGGRNLDFCLGAEIGETPMTPHRILDAIRAVKAGAAAQ